MGGGREFLECQPNDIGAARARLDVAIEAILEHRDHPYVESCEHAAVVKTEVERLRYRANDSVRSHIRISPWQVVGAAAAVGFVPGLTLNSVEHVLRSSTPHCPLEL